MIEIIAGAIGELIFWWFSKEYGSFFPEDYLGLINIAVIVGFAVVGHLVKIALKANNHDID